MADVGVLLVFLLLSGTRYNAMMVAITLRAHCKPNRLVITRKIVDKLDTNKHLCLHLVCSLVLLYTVTHMLYM